MKIVVLTALGVGGATVFGAVIGFIFKKISERYKNVVLSFAAGIMLFAAVVGLILPSLEYGNDLSFIITVAGIVCGALCIWLIDKLVPHIHNFSSDKSDAEIPPASGERGSLAGRVMLFVLAIAIHNLPEGIAAGVSFGMGDIESALMVSVGIALQNIPEGMIIIAPMLSIGTSKKKTFLIASLTGAIEVVGTFIGYFAVSLAEAILPFALSFAGGTMLYVIESEIIPEVHENGKSSPVSFAMIIGFCVMLVVGYLI